VCYAFEMATAVEGKKMTHHDDETPSGQGNGFQKSKRNRLNNLNSHARFTGTDNPRHLRAIAALLRRPISRQELDSVAGCANGPELIAELRRRGLGANHLPCERIKFIDRDGNLCRPGVYSLTAIGRRMIHAWLATRGKPRALHG
jgi:hypothetical protein